MFEISDFILSNPTSINQLIQPADIKLDDLVDSVRVTQSCASEPKSAVLVLTLASFVAVSAKAARCYRAYSPRCRRRRNREIATHSRAIAYRFG